MGERSLGQKALDSARALRQRVLWCEQFRPLTATGQQPVTITIRTIFDIAREVEEAAGLLEAAADDLASLGFWIADCPAGGPGEAG